MIATYVPPTKTPLTFDDAATALRTALSAGKRELVRDDVLALALAKTALETGRWRSMWNWNWGNVKAGPQYSGMYTCIRLNEVIAGKVVWFEPDSDGYAVPPGHPQTRMRAYANRYDGAYEYVAALVSHFPKAYEVLFGADAAAFVRELKYARYFTAAEGPYRDAVQKLQQEFLRTLRGMPVDEPHECNWDDLRQRVAAQQFDTLEMARET